MTWTLDTNITDKGNSTTVALSGGATYTGTWTDLTIYSTVIVLGSSDVVGTLWYDFSADGTTADRSVQLSPGDTVDWGIHALTPVTKWGRVRVVNGAGAQTTLVVATALSVEPRTIVSRAAQTISDHTDVQNTRLVSAVSLDEARGTHADRIAVHKFGRNPDVGAGVEEDIWTSGGAYSGWLTAAATVRVQAGGNAADAAAGLGAQKVLVKGLDENWAEVSEELTCNADGTLASAATTTTFIRVYCAHVTDCGTYGATNTGAMTIETSGGVVVANIGTVVAGAGVGETQLSTYTIPAGYEGYCRRLAAEVEGTKSADIYFWQRQNADDVTTPFTARRAWHVIDHLSGHQGENFESFIGPFPAKTDLWASAVGPSGGAGVEVDYDLILVKV